MTTQAGLVALKCLRCSTPVPAGLDEVAWACGNCEQGLLLDDDQGLAPLDLHYAEIPPQTTGRPFWVIEGRVQLDRQTYRKSDQASVEAETFWQAPRRFYIPAFTCALDDFLEMGVALLQDAPDLTPGPPAPFQPVTLSGDDARLMAEFLVVHLEAGRSDQLEKIDFSLKSKDPILWILP